MAGIQTGVDKLVNLLHEKKKVTIDDAAKALGVSKAVVQEWSDFLSEEGLLEIKYSLSKTYLVERVLSKQEFQQKERAFESQRETFINKVDAAIAQLDQESANFEKFKSEFQEIKQQLGSDLEVLEKDAAQLKEYETLKTSVMADLQKQHQAFSDKQREAEAALQREYRQYQEVLHSISQQEKKLALEKDKVHKILSSEATVQNKIDAYTKLLEKLKTRVTDESKELGVDEQTLDQLQNNAISFKNSLEAINKDNLQPLFAMKEQQEQEVKKLEKQIIDKAAAIEKTVRDPVAKRPAVKKQLQAFFKRKKLLDDMLAEVDKDKQELVQELKELQQRAEAYQLGKTSVRLEELESKLNLIEERKKGLADHIMKFIRLLH